MNVVIAGGGTAGHVFPAVALARELADAHGASVRFLGTPGGLEARLVPAAGFAFAPISAAPVRRELSLATLRAPFTAIRSIAACRPLVADADVVVGMGGYVSVPPVLAGGRERRPVVLHEQNAVLGLANRLLARRARAVALSFSDAAAQVPRGVRTVITGNPVREEILEVPRRRDELRHEAVRELGLAADRSTIVVFGGSQGARHLDATVAGAIGHLAGRDDLQLIVLTGPDHVAVVAGAAEAEMRLRVRVFPFLDRMELAFAVADAIVARAGATSIAELAVCGLPSLLVPYPHATANHQDANARELERAGAAEVLADRELDPADLAARIARFLDDPRRRSTMAARALAWAKPDAARRLADEVVEAAG